MKKILTCVISLVLIICVIIVGTYATAYAGHTVQTNNTVYNNDTMVIDNRPQEWSECLFPKDKVFELRINIDDSDLEYMNENAMDTPTVPATVLYNGIKMNNVGVRPKGNSSLMTAVMDGKNQYSFSLDFDAYINQNLFGIKSIKLNNGNMDSSYIREYLAYELFDEMGVPVPEMSYCNLYVNDELYGPYLAVQKVDDVMANAWFNKGDGYLYKPDGIGADLSYIDNSYSSYKGMIEKTTVDKQGKQDLIHMLDVLNNGGDIEEVLDVDMVLRYLAVSSAIINLDCYQGGMFHNYYLYGENGKYTIIPWDLNITFMPFGMDGMNENKISVTEYLIDEPTSGAVDKYPLIDRLLSVPEYLERYRSYIEYLVNGPLHEDVIEQKALELHAMLDKYVKADPKSVHEYDDFKNSLYQSDDLDKKDKETDKKGFNPMKMKAPPLIDFVTKRNDNIRKQLSGKIPSGNNDNGNPENPFAKMVGKMEGGLKIDGNMPPINKDMFDTEHVASMMADMGIDIEDMPFPMVEGSMTGGNMQKSSNINRSMMINMLLGGNPIYYIYVIIAIVVLIIFAVIIKRRNPIKISK